MNIFALLLLLFVVLTLFYGFIAIHDIPYEISKKRNHPHQDSIHVAGWVSLFTLHAIWPFLWIWATLYREDRGWGFSQTGGPVPASMEQVSALEQRLAKLEQQLRAEAPAQEGDR